MSDLSITNVVNISVSTTPTGVNAYNTSNLALFTHETPGGGFGALGYKIYKEPTDVATDFGSSNKVYKMANAVFSQQPNILTGDGNLIVIPMETNISEVIAQQLVSFTTVPTVGTYQLGYGENYTGDINYNDSAATIQTALRLLAGLSTITISGDTTAGFTVVFTGVSGPATLLSVRQNSLQDTDGYDVFVSSATTVPGVAAGSNETLDAAITRTKGLVSYFGIMESDTVAQQTEEVLDAAAAVIQPLNMIGFFVSYTPDDIAPGGMLDDLATGGLTKSRALYYEDSTTSGLNAMLMMAAYASRALSTSFAGSNTTQTMHLKELVGIEPDPAMTETTKTVADVAGADIYASIQGQSCVLCSGANDFFDQVYNQEWLVGALEVAGFNYLRQSSTKIPQTDSGVDGLKGAYRRVLEQAVTNAYCAPGTWTSPTTFGNSADLIANVAQKGYYIYSAPVGQQLQADRAARKAPLVQIALKEAGAVHSTNVIVNLNA